jgi:hypothetical protein
MKLRVSLAAGGHDPHRIDSARHDTLSCNDFVVDGESFVVRTILYLFFLRLALPLGLFLACVCCTRCQVAPFNLAI